MDISKFYNVVGISERECDCFDSANKEEFKTSYSGYYSDNFKYGMNIFTAQNSKDCGDGSVWEILQETRKQAINDLVTHFLIEADKVKNTTLANTAMSIVENKMNKNITSDSVAGLKLMPKVWKGVNMYLKTVDLYIDSVQSYTVKVIRVEDLFEVATDTQTGGNNTKITFDFNTRIPLYDGNGEAIDYLITYETNGGKPMNTELHCGCSNKTYLWESFFEVHGMAEPDLATMQDSETYSNYGYGLRVHISLDCESLSWLEGVENDFWKNTKFGRVFSMVLLNYWTIATLNKLLNNEKPSYYSTLKREEMYGKRAKAEKIVNELVPFLAQRMPEELSHCYTCDYDFGFEKMSIISS